MKISMQTAFKIIEIHNGNFTQVSNDEAQSVSIGGYSFEINGDLIPFDWDCFSGHEEDKIFYFETGHGFFWDDYELSDCYDDEYEEIGLSKADITAEFLASVENIEEFYVDCYNEDPKYILFIELLEVSFIEIETGKEYKVKQSVINAFNERERSNANESLLQIGKW